MRPEAAFALVLVTLFFAGLAFVLYDLNQNPERIDESQNEAILGEFVSTIEEFKTVETDVYSMKIPADWVNVNRPEIIINGQRFYPDRYQGVTRENVGRRIDVFQGDIPNIAADKALKIDANGAFLRVGSISPQCLSFTELESPDLNQATPTEWEGLEFVCRMTIDGNDIVAVETNTAAGVNLSGDKNDETFMFMFTDRGTRQDNTIFQDILNTFRVK